jgi:hypothetical protein
MLLSTFSGVQMHPADIQVVADFYDTNGLADYKAFLRDIEDSVELFSTPPPSPSRAPVDVSSILDTLKTMFTERRVLARSFFPEGGRGTMSKYAFEKTLRQAAGTLTPAEVSALSEAFLAGPGEVDYDAFVATFETPPPSDDVSELCDRVRASLAARRRQLRPALARFDRRPSIDEVVKTQLVVALQDCSVVLPPHDVDRLLHAFPGTGRDTASISALCDAVDPVLPAVAPEPGPARPSGPPSPARALLPAPPAHVLAIVARIAHAAASLGVDLPQEFRRLDRLRHGRVSETQWRGVVALLNGRVVDPELRIVFEQYRTPDGFDYPAFCRDCAPGQEERRVSDEPSIVSDVLRKCKAFVVSKMLTLDVLFRAYDPVGTGFAPVSSIARAFTSYGLLLTESEVVALAEAFRDRRLGDRFNYAELGRRLTGIVVTREEHVPTLHSGWTDEEYKRVLSSVRTELKEKLHARPRAFRRLLSNVRQDVVSERDFLKALEDAGVVLLKEQINALLQCYRIEGTRDIDFIRFSQDIQNTDLIGRR